MISLVQTIILGLLVGALYALMASGLTLIFGVMRVINLAHGAFAILAAFLTFTLWQRLGLDPILSIPLVMAVMFAIGWIVYVLVIRHVRGSHVSMTVLATFGVALVLEGIMGFIWGNTSHSVRAPYTDASISLGPLYVPQVMLIAAVIAVLVIGGLYLLLNRTWVGRAIRAASVNESGALLVGVSVATIAALTFAIGVATLGRRRGDAQHDLPVPARFPLPVDRAAARHRRARRAGQPARIDHRRPGHRGRRDRRHQLHRGLVAGGGPVPRHHRRADHPTAGHPRHQVARGCGRMTTAARSPTVEARHSRHRGRRRCRRCAVPAVAERVGAEHHDPGARAGHRRQRAQRDHRLHRLSVTEPGRVHRHRRLRRRPARTEIPRRAAAAVGATRWRRGGSPRDAAGVGDLPVPRAGVRHHHGRISVPGAVRGDRVGPGHQRHRRADAAAAGLARRVGQLALPSDPGGAARPVAVDVVVDSADQVRDGPDRRSAKTKARPERSA